MKTVRVGPVAVFPRGHYMIDVFTGKGYESHSVFKVINGIPKLQSGASLSKEDYETLKDMI